MQTTTEVDRIAAETRRLLADDMKDFFANVKVYADACVQASLNGRGRPHCPGMQPKLRQLVQERADDAVEADLRFKAVA